ncbi:MAG TPA: hypothetical protein PLA69_07660, partial [Flavobacterium sp.]|nr:hypothetical protein [Flavobacterium sp.]
PIVPGTTVQYTINNPFPATPGTRTYYAVPPNSAPSCNFTFTITVTSITTQPSVQNISYCQGAVAVPLTATPSSPGLTLYWYTSQNGSSVSEITPSTTTPGSTTYYVAEGQSSLCIGTKVPVIVTVYPAPVWQAPAAANVSGCSTAAITGLPFTETETQINLTQFTNAGGSVSNAGAIGTYTLTYQDASSGTCPIQVTRTFRLTTVCGTLSLTQNINIQDSVSPVIAALPATATIDCSAGAPVFAQATATDNCGDATLTFVDVTTPGACAGSYSVTRTWTATDACGNTATASQTINVQDVTAPVISPLPSASTISCGTTPVFETPTAVDGCGSAVTLTSNDVETPGACQGTYTITRTWTATDACGNMSTASQAITVTDTVAPVISALPAPSTIQCPATPVFAQPTATDNCGATVTLNFVDATTPGACDGSYSVTRTWTAVDACGNTSTALQTITVEDNSAPTITTQAQNLTLQCSTGNQDALTNWLANNGGAVAQDTCSAVTWTNDYSAVAGNCSESVVVTFTATDDCGNAASSSATFTLQDNTAPV